ncbi:MAG: hypothetical protein ACLUE1_07920 [Adlercreutzia equolifaciens]
MVPYRAGRELVASVQGLKVTGCWTPSRPASAEGDGRRGAGPSVPSRPRPPAEGGTDAAIP